MLSDTAGTTPTYLVVKSGVTQSDGNQINVAGGSYPVEYTRVMNLNPVANALWNSDNVIGMQIGVKNNNPGTGGVSVSDLQFDCE